MPPLSDHLFIRLGQIFEGAAEGLFAICALLLAFVVALVATVWLLAGA